LGNWIFWGEKETSGWEKKFAYHEHQVQHHGYGVLNYLGFQKKGQSALLLFCQDFGLRRWITHPKLF
jgi:hypothetical protein